MVGPGVNRRMPRYVEYHNQCYDYLKHEGTGMLSYFIMKNKPLEKCSSTLPNAIQNTMLMPPVFVKVLAIGGPTPSKQGRPDAAINTLKENILRSKVGQNRTHAMGR